MDDQSEAEIRIIINDLLADSKWRLKDTNEGIKNVRLERHLKNTLNDAPNNKGIGFADYILLDEKNFPIGILEAKIDEPLIGKEQAREYALSQGVRFIILSNGTINYLWDLDNGNPTLISYLPSQKDLAERLNYTPNFRNLSEEEVTEDYIVLSQDPHYELDPRWSDDQLKKKFIKDSGFRFLRKYQLDAVEALQEATKHNKNRFLFEMATGTGKTLISAAVIKLYLKSGNARRILFLVDRLELETQAYKAFVNYLGKDYRTVIYKDDRKDWNKAEIVVTTIQSISFNERYKQVFSPNDFDLIISDEAHRSVAGNNKNIFEYFLGHKLGLTATPKDYLKNFTDDELNELNRKELEARNLKSTYKIFGCESGEPTFRFTLVDGVKEGFLIPPTAIDCRTDITTQLLEDNGYSYVNDTENGEAELKFTERDFEKKFYSENTNKQFVEVFFQNALKDPFTQEIGKTIVFAVSQYHALKLTQLLNEYAHKYYPGKYNSDFAVQVTSKIHNAQQMTNQFTHDSNNLNGTTRFLEGYESSKTRVCVTVGMMTTGYDCQDLLNLCLCRPIFSPSDFVQIKGRGTRKYIFELKHRVDGEEFIETKEKTKFKIFDFFGNFEYFEEKYDYDAKLELPVTASPAPSPEPPGDPEGTTRSKVDVKEIDFVTTYIENEVNVETSKIDNQMFAKQTKKQREEALIKEFQIMVNKIIIDVNLVEDASKLFVRYILFEEIRNSVEQKQYNQLSSDQDFFQTLLNLGQDNIERIIKYIKENHLC